MEDYAALCQHIEEDPALPIFVEENLAELCCRHNGFRMLARQLDRLHYVEVARLGGVVWYLTLRAGC